MSWKDKYFTVPSSNSKKNSLSSKSTKKFYFKNFKSFCKVLILNTKSLTPQIIILTLEFKNGYSIIGKAWKSNCVTLFKNISY